MRGNNLRKEPVRKEGDPGSSSSLKPALLTKVLSNRYGCTGRSTPEAMVSLFNIWVNSTGGDTGP